jgi:hypothetical protein
MHLHPLKTLLGSALIAMCCLITTQSDAATITLGSPVALSTLLSSGDTNPSLLVGDKLFDTFAFAATGDMPGAVNVNVIPIQDGDGNYGIRFQGAFIDLPGDGGSDALITYRVAVTRPEPWRITDAHLVGNPNLLGTTGSASVTETFLPDSLLSMEIHDNGGAVKSMDAVDFPFPGFRELHVQKDILLFGGDAPATISFVDQTFSQVPEASAALLTMIACVGFTAKRRRG